MKQTAICRNETEAREALCNWFTSEPGASLLQMEWACLEQLLADQFGYYLVQLGCLGQQAIHLRASRIRTQFIVGGDGAAQGSLSGLRCYFHQLPLASTSVDLVLLPHTLDFDQQPQQVLREVERVLIPGGRLIVLGFNPLSLWGVWRLFRHRSGRVPWCGHFLSRRRLHDWLSLLGFRVEVSRGLMYRPPVSHAGLQQRLMPMERLGPRFGRLLSGVTVIQAVKQESALTPIQPAWKIRRRPMGGRVVEPTARNFRT